MAGHPYPFLSLAFLSLAAVALLFVGGCAAPEMRSTVINSAYLSSPFASDKVEIRFRSPDRPYVEIAQFNAINYPADKRQEMYDTLRSRAGALGADAVCVRTITHNLSTGTSSMTHNSLGSTYSYSTGGPSHDEHDTITAVAIRYTQ